MFVLDIGEKTSSKCGITVFDDTAKHPGNRYALNLYRYFLWFKASTQRFWKNSALAEKCKKSAQLNTRSVSYNAIFPVFTYLEPRTINEVVVVQYLTKQIQQGSKRMHTIIFCSKQNRTDWFIQMKCSQIMLASQLLLSGVYSRWFSIRMTTCTK